MLCVLLLHGTAGAPAAASAGHAAAATAAAGAILVHPAGAVNGAVPGRVAADGAIGIRLLEIPANRADDPRARYFIVDHVNPGTTFTRRLEVHSTSPKPQRVELYAAAADIKGSRFTFAPERTANELSSWITLDRAAVDLPARGSARVKATVAVPEWAGKAERYAVIWAQVSSAQPGPQGNVAIVNRVGIRAYLDVGPGGEPASDFTIGDVVPLRAEDGRPQVTVAVANTGHRALDIEGRLSLSGGPSSMSAGPFPVSRGTTLAPGGRGEVVVPLGVDLPSGPWKFRLTLRSGRVEHTETGTLTLPEKAGAWGLPAVRGFPLTPVLTATGLLAVAVAVALLLVLRARRLRTRPEVPAGHPPDGFA